METTTLTWILAGTSAVLSIICIVLMVVINHLRYQLDEQRLRLGGQLHVARRRLTEFRFPDRAA